MKRIGIMTQYHNSENYGGLLQAYALNAVIRKLGYECETIDYAGTVSRSFPILSIRTSLLFLKVLISKLLRVLKKARYTPDIDFVNFRENAIPHSTLIYDDKNILDLNQAYDCFVCGSDRIWHTRPLSLMNDKFLLSFARDKKCIAYAASAESNDISEEEASFYRKHLAKFSGVGLRESQLCEAFSRFDVFSDAKHVLDPVFLLTKNEWGEMAVSPAFNKPYLFLYVLGNNSESLEKIKQFVGGYAIQIVVAPKSNSTVLDFAKKQKWIIPEHCTPEEFLGYIEKSNYTITDSFHCLALSIMNKKNICLINRDFGVKNTAFLDRISSLLKMLEIKNSIYDSTIEYVCPDYDKVSGRLEKLRKESIDFLEQQLID